MVIHFNPQKLPRTMTRQQWYSLWRKYRDLRHQLWLQSERTRLSLRYMPEGEAKKNIMDLIINPPVVIFP